MRQLTDIFGIQTDVALRGHPGLQALLQKIKLT